MAVEGKAIPSTAPSIIMGTKIALGKTWDEDSLGLVDERTPILNPLYPLHQECQPILNPLYPLHQECQPILNPLYPLHQECQPILNPLYPLHQECQPILNPLYPLHQECQPILNPLYPLHQECQPILNPLYPLHQECQPILNPLYPLHQECQPILNPLYPLHQECQPILKSSVSAVPSVSANSKISVSAVPKEPAYSNPTKSAVPRHQPTLNSLYPLYLKSQLVLNPPHPPRLRSQSILNPPNLLKLSTGQEFIKPLTNSSGIYFDPIGSLSLVDSYLSVVIPLKTSFINPHINNLHYILENSKSLCEESKVLDNVECNNLFLPLLTRFQDIKRDNEAISYLMSHQIKRSALLGVIGTLSKKLFGTMDEEDAIRYFSKDQIVFVLEIPLVKPQRFSLYHNLPCPVPYEANNPVSLLTVRWPGQLIQTTPFLAWTVRLTARCSSVARISLYDVPDRTMPEPGQFSPMGQNLNVPTTEKRTTDKDELLHININ
ncbi:hypothetical protein HW555_012786 [Spodoptera exigua]|uniref:Uncharacterized protein n=1 Tax=Spodoptera exigua TaxID=7107 RepID=A0A835KXL6_SPOEX|nr:hypothetical protein HW555_012786 [Spodoptera exigua]